MVFPNLNGGDAETPAARNVYPFPSSDGAQGKVGFAQTDGASGATGPAGNPGLPNSEIAVENVMSELTREEMKLEVTASELRNENKITRLEGKIDTLAATIIGKLDAASERASTDHEYNRSTRWVVIGLIIAVGLGLAGLMVGMATYGDAMFGRGMNVHDLVQSLAKEMNTLPLKPKAP